ncbi:MAG: tRNA uridine-5-carboxymethylaminomethyl(34) synthesis enzyme MnmG [Candidatus Zixiibacteriota bacterium]|nr:MAG: tRNA uridine-5-carboxymethylaminomethyl(34) synthesis enzyme MnmG [candidate division Zixibacteria bacterium]
MKHSDFDILVIGGGHAGVEAALAASRTGKTVGLISLDKTKLAMMSCNPSIGGLGKSHIVKEIDALGGLMARAIDATGIQFRKLNLSRGPAVWSTRVQADRAAYNNFVCRFVDADRNISVIEASADSILAESGSATGVELDSGEKLMSKAVIVCTGTFLGGLIHIGEKKIRAGRKGEKAAYKLTDSLRSLGFEVGRLKTGTPPRLDGTTIDYELCEIQPGIEPIPFFSYTTKPYEIKQVPCFLTHTTQKTKQIIEANLRKSPIFSGQIKSAGPRYCPSIEDKIYRFGQKERHQIFLEPEGRDNFEVYPNGFSTSLPEDIQFRAIRTITGLENVEITQPGYAIEYDYCPAYQIDNSLETSITGNLYFAGQINGTSGYEEAAGQGLLAGLNASLKIDREPALILSRAESYIGVMIDDLVTRSTTEPYRMFTSRAEYRLCLREDNARDRLFDYANKYNLIPKEDYSKFKLLQKETESEISKLRKTVISVSKLGKLADIFEKKENVSLAELLTVPGVEYDDIEPFIAETECYKSDIIALRERAAIFIKYKGYIRKQEREIARFRHLEGELIPKDMPYGSLNGLRREAQEKFVRFKPLSLGQASRIEGITTGDIAALSIHLKKYNNRHKNQMEAR